MPKPSLRVSRERAEGNIQKLETIRVEMRNLPSKTQYLLSEILLIRLASILEDYIGECAYKIACGTPYENGDAAVLLYNARSMPDARNAMLRRNRARPKQSLSWTRASYIKQSVEHVIGSTDHFVTKCDQFGSIWSELFKVRTFAAHRSSSSRENFRAVVRMVYGQPRRMELGQFLLSPHLVVRPNLDRYIQSTRVFVKELVKAP